MNSTHKKAVELIIPIIEDLCIDKGLDITETKAYVLEKLNKRPIRQLCQGKIGNGLSCTCEAKYNKDGQTDNDNPLYCGRHILRDNIPNNTFIICKGSRKDRCQCTRQAKPGHIYCGNHLFLEDKTDDDYRLDNRTCIFSENGDILKPCNKLARHNGYTCVLHKKHEETWTMACQLDPFPKFLENFDIYKKNSHFRGILWNHCN
jgi:hypothetical protein